MPTVMVLAPYSFDSGPMTRVVGVRVHTVSDEFGTRKVIEVDRTYPHRDGFRTTTISDYGPVEIVNWD